MNSLKLYYGKKYDTLQFICESSQFSEHITLRKKYESLEDVHN